MNATMTKVTTATILATAALFSATATATADGIISHAEADYIITYGQGAVCPTIADYPTPSGVLGVAQGIMDDGFAADSAIDIINVSVLEYCPEYWGLLQQMGGHTVTVPTPLQKAA